MNQLGFLPAGAKRAIVADPSPTPLDWRLRDGAGRVLPLRQDRAVRRRCRLGRARPPDRFRRLFRAGGRLSNRDRRRGAAAPSPSRRRFTTGCAWIRSTISTRPAPASRSRRASPAGPQWARPAGHLPEKAVCVSAVDFHGNAWPGCAGAHDVTGGWYDAGDQGKYVVNGGIALWTLLDLYEREKARGIPSRLCGRQGASAGGRQWRERSARRGALGDWNSS